MAEVTFEVTVTLGDRIGVQTVTYPRAARVVDGDDIDDLLQLLCSLIATRTHVSWMRLRPPVTAPTLSRSSSP